MLISNHHAELNTEESSPAAVGVVWIPRQPKSRIRTRRDLRLPTSSTRKYRCRSRQSPLRRPSRYSLGTIRRWWRLQKAHTIDPTPLASRPRQPRPIAEQTANLRFSCRPRTSLHPPSSSSTPFPSPTGPEDALHPASQTSHKRLY